MSILNVWNIHGFGDRAIFNDILPPLKGEHIGLCANGEKESLPL